MWTAALTEEYILKKVKEMMDQEGRVTESIQKSLRRYGTEIHPLFLERLRSYGIDLFEDMSTISSVTTKSYTYFPTSQGMQGNRVMNYVMQSFFDYEEPAWGGQVLYLTASSKTQDPSFELNRSISESLRKRIYDLSVDSKEPISLVLLAKSYLGSDVTSELLAANFQCTPVFRGIQSFLFKHKGFPHSSFVTMPGRKLTSDMNMVTKYYAARDDFRAYVRDTNALRHLAGICLHCLVLPQNMEFRRSLHSNRVIPAKDKDILNLRIPRPQLDQVALLILGDVSNFTGSLANAWLMLFCMAAQIAQWGAESKKPNLYAVKGSVFSATWYEVIMIYLYLTVGYPAYVDELKDFAYLPGGFLGVSANITVGLLFLALVLENLLGILQRTCTYAQAQAGGDDFSFAIVLHNDDKDPIVALIREHFVRYVGNLKEFHVIDLAHIREGVVGEYKFCKKRIVLSMDSSNIYLRGQDNPPVPACLLPAGRISDAQAQQVWSSYSTTLSIWERANGCPQHTDTLRQLFLLTYPSLAPARLYDRRTVYHQSSELFRVGTMYLTKLAQDISLRVRSYQLGSVVYLGEWEDKIRYCLKSGKLSCTKAEWRGRVRMIVLHDCERSLIVRRVDDRVVGLVEDGDFLRRILNLIYK